MTTSLSADLADMVAEVVAPTPALRAVKCVVCQQPTGEMTSTGGSTRNFGQPTCPNCDPNLVERDMRHDHPEAFDMDESDEAEQEDLRPVCQGCGHTHFQLQRTYVTGTDTVDTADYDDSMLYFDSPLPDVDDETIVCRSCDRDVTGEIAYDVS